MKKILVTTLALSLAMVSTVDARKIMSKSKGGAKPAEVLNAAKELMDAKKNNEPMMEPAKDTIAALSNPDMTPEQKELVAQRIKQADLERDIKLQKNEIADINYGWFGFGTTKEQQESYKQAKRDLADLNTDLKNVNSRIRELEVTTGKAWSNSVRFGIGALTAAGITAIAYAVDKYKFEGKGMQYLSERGTAGRETASEMYETAKSKVRNAYGAAKTRIVGE